MRRLVLFLMIALLAVRGWAGAVMSVEMSVQNLVVVPMMASSVYDTGSGGAGQAETNVHSGNDCPDHAAMQAVGNEVAEGSSHCNTCVICQICHTVALMGIAPQKVAPVGVVSPITAAGARFVSAVLRTGFKPPIS